jgi:hypothetical protein
VVAAQVEIESKTRKQCDMLQFQVLSSRRCQNGLHRVNLHRLTSWWSITRVTFASSGLN